MGNRIGLCIAVILLTRGFGMAVGKGVAKGRRCCGPQAILPSISLKGMHCLPAFMPAKE